MIGLSKELSKADNNATYKEDRQNWTLIGFESNNINSYLIFIYNKPKMCLLLQPGNNQINTLKLFSFFECILKKFIQIICIEKNCF